VKEEEHKMNVGATGNNPSPAVTVQSDRTEKPTDPQDIIVSMNAGVATPRTLTGLPSTQNVVTLSRPTMGPTLESIGICSTVMGIPSMLGAAFGWGGMAVGMAGVAAIVHLGVHSKEDRAILLPLALLTGGIAGVAGTLFGWPGAIVATGLGAAYGWKCA